MDIAMIIYPVRGREIFLAIKKEKTGAGKLNGWGGKLKPEDGGSVEKAAIRELFEESRAKTTVGDLEKVAIIDFFEAGQHMYECYVYLCHDWIGELQETGEMGVGTGYPIDNPPFDRMMKADRAWLPIILSGKKVRVSCCYTKGHKAVEKIECRPL